MGKQLRELSKSQKKEADRKYYNPPTKEYRIYRIVWGVMLAAALCIGIYTLFNVATLPELTRNILIGAANVLIIGAICLDLFKVRTLRKAYQLEMMGPKTKARRAEEKRIHAEEVAARKAAAAAGEDAEPYDPEQEKGFMKRVIARANASGEAANIKGSGL